MIEKSKIKLIDKKPSKENNSILVSGSFNIKEVLLMVLLNSMTGGLRTEIGFDSNFNLLLPLLMSDNCSTNNSECEKMQKNLMIMMMALQSTVRK